jgi:RNA polymerase sigma factor (sigma-70 family)
MRSPRDSVDFWLDAAGKYPLLPHAEMLRLGNIIQNPETPQEARKRAVNKLVCHNLRLIPSIVRRVIGPKRTARFGDVLTADLLQSGVIGLNRAAELFDPTLGYSFTTYANMWVYQAVQREATDHISMIRVPESTIRDYYSITGGNSKEKLSDLPEKKKERMSNAHFAINCFSLEQRLTQDRNYSDRTYFDVVEGQSTPVASDTFDDIIALAPFLDDTQRSLLEMVYVKNFTQKEAARQLNLTRDQFANLHKRALRQLRFVMTR